MAEPPGVHRHMTEYDISTSKAIQRRTGATFHVATRLLPQRVREPTYVLYAFFRLADEVVDGPGDPDPEAQRQRLERFRRAALGERNSDHPVLVGFQQVRENHGIAEEEVNAFIDAMLMDIDRTGYENHAELEQYLRGSSVAVARMMTDVMDPDDRAMALPHADALGKAFQLTNFLRDVREDVCDHGRIYVPASVRRRHGVTADRIHRCEPDERFRSLVREELDRTEALYRQGVAGIHHLPKDCQFAVTLSATLYADHHRLIRGRDCDTLTGTPSLSTRRRLSIAGRTWLRWKQTGDPTAVFDAVTDVPEGPVGLEAWRRLRDAPEFRPVEASGDAD